MDETEENLNETAVIPKRKRSALTAIGPVMFGVLVIACAIGAFITGGYISLGRDGIQETIAELQKPDDDQVNRPTHEWIELEKTIYQLDRREEAKYVLAKFTLRAPIEKAEEVRQRLPELEFALQTYIRELSSRELQGAMGLYNLRNACLFRARRILGRDAVEDILIGELLVE